MPSGIITTYLALRYVVGSGFINSYPAGTSPHVLRIYSSGKALMKPFGCERAALGSSTAFVLIWLFLLSGIIYVR